MSKSGLVGLFVALSLAGVSQVSLAQSAGAQTLGITVEQETVVVNGWSVKKAILGKSVYNENNEKVGTIDDIIIAPEGSVSYAIIGAGHFLHVARHDVAIPVEQINVNDSGQYVLPGATRDALKAMPVFQYEKVPSKPAPRKVDTHH
ncbi:MAG: PRC-barrel domain-containing protein [Pararobbsia sp.]